MSRHPLTIFQLTDPDLLEAYLVGYFTSADVGDLVAMRPYDEKRFEVLEVYPFEPLGLLSEYEVALAIVHPTNQAAPDASDWYCWEMSSYSAPPSLRVFLYEGAILCIEDSKSDQPPDLDRQRIMLHRSRRLPKPPKLDRSSVLRQAAISKPSLELNVRSYERYDGAPGYTPYARIYVVQAETFPEP